MNIFYVFSSSNVLCAIIGKGCSLIVHFVMHTWEGWANVKISLCATRTTTKGTKEL